MACGGGVGGAVSLGKPPLKKRPEQVVVIIASYPLFKKINALARNIVAMLCCTLILGMCVIKSVGDLKT